MDHGVGEFLLQKTWPGWGEREGSIPGAGARGAQELQVWLWKDRASSRAGRGAFKNHS